MRRLILFLGTFLIFANSFGLNPPNLLSPHNNATGIPVQAWISFSQVSGATAYQVLMDTTQNFDSPALMELNVAVNEFDVRDLMFNTTYYWKARAMNDTDTSAWSPVWVFTTTRFAADLEAPGDGATNQPVKITLWLDNQTDGIDTFIFQVDTTPDFSSPALYVRKLSSYYSGLIVKNLKFEQQYFWRVCGFNQADTSDWSQTWSFTTTRFAADLQSPANGATNQPVKITLWLDNKTDGVDTFIFQVDTTPDFSSPALYVRKLSSYYSGLIVKNLKFGQQYFWRVCGFNQVDTSDWSQTWSFTTTRFAADLQSPANGATNQPVKITLWLDNQTDGVDTFIFQVDTIPDFSSPALYVRKLSSQYSGLIVKNLKFGQQYFWRVCGFNQADTSDWSQTWSFTTTRFGATPHSPADNAFNINVNTVLWVDFVNGVDTIEYLLDTTSAFNSPLLRRLKHSSDYSGVNVYNLLYGTKYYWKTRGRHQIDTSDWSQVWSFTTVYQLHKPNLTAPDSNASNLDFSLVNLSWDTVGSATNYIYQVSENSDFSRIFAGGSTVLNFASISNLDYGTRYYWRVKAQNDSGYSPWSNVWTFTTKLIYPEIISPADGEQDVGIPVILSWHPVRSALNYMVKLADNPDFNDSVIYNITDTTLQLNYLQQNTTYYWQIKAFSSIAQSDWSPVYSFKTFTQSSDVKSIASQIKIYPNPSESKFFVKTPYDGTLQIIDLTGKTVFKKPLHAGNNEINISGLDGLFLVKIRLKQATIVKSIIFRQ